MKKILIAALVAASLVTPAQAGDRTSAIVGGVIGGLFLGELLRHHHNYESYPPQYVYQPAPPPPHQVCGTQWTSEWNRAYQMWERVPHTVCWWEN